ncbi:hypothetical protein GCK32_008017, partial [Trichostrongylus colubriformis]
MRVLNEAMSGCYEKVMSDEENELKNDPDVNILLQDREKAKCAMLEIILSCPEFNPAVWGGEGTIRGIMGVGDALGKGNEVR